MRDAKPGRYVIDEHNAAIDLFNETLGDLVAGCVAAGCPPQDVATILHRFGRMMADEHARRQHAEAMAKQDAARRAVLLTPTPAEDLAPPRRRRRYNGGQS
ncbi:hypothetical protein [Reyranella aquatilis]|nr:hypothetical protein [Reyranella aquatilis]